jgi:hypothetical protein
MDQTEVQALVVGTYLAKELLTLKQVLILLVLLLCLVILDQLFLPCQVKMI